MRSMSNVASQTQFQQSYASAKPVNMADYVFVTEDPTVNGKAALANRDFDAGQVIGRIDLTTDIVDCADRYTIQVTDTAHIKGSALGDCVYLNHSCSPSCHLHFHDDALDFVASQACKKGDSLTFNYVTSEWEMATPFDCACGKPGCIGSVRGFKHLEDQQKASLVSLVTPFIAQKYAQEQEKLR
eukprot:CFRG2387T1